MKTSIAKLAKYFGQNCLTNETKNKSAEEIAEKSQQKYTNTFHCRKLEEWVNEQRGKYFLSELSQEYIDKENSLNWLLYIGTPSLVSRYYVG